MGDNLFVIRNDDIMLGGADITRSIEHNEVILNVSILNNLAKVKNKEPIYTGTISENKPCRREIADAVFTFMREVRRAKNQEEI